MSRPRVRTLSGGRRAAAARSPSLAAWWTRTRRPGVGSSSRTVGGLGPPDHAADEARTFGRLAFVAALVDATQLAPDQDAVWAALRTALRGLGLNGYGSLLADGGAFLVGGTLAVSAAGAAELERVVARAPEGARIGVAGATPYRAVLETGQTVRVEAPQRWARLALPSLGEQEARAVAGLIELGDAVLAPIAAGDDVFGVLTVWAPRLSEADVALAGILGRVVGVALAGLADGAAAHRAGGAPTPRTAA